MYYIRLMSLSFESSAYASKTILHNTVEIKKRGADDRVEFKSHACYPLEIPYWNWG